MGEPAGEEDTVYAMLVVRESAVAEWKVTQSVFIPAKLAPTLVAAENNAVPTASAEFKRLAAQASQNLEHYLETGKVPAGEADFAFPTQAFSNFRKYVNEFTQGEDAFEKAEVECNAFQSMNLQKMAISTKTGAVSFGEQRCTITLVVPEDAALDLGPSIEAVRTTDKDGNQVQIDVSIPYLFLTDNTGKPQIIGSDWFVLSSRTSDAK